jgi:exosortase
MKANTAPWFVQPLWLLVAGYWLWLAWACAGDWIETADYNYGWFVPPLALYFLWKRLEEVAGQGSGVTGEGSGGRRPETEELRPEVGGQISEVRGQVSHVGEDSHVPTAPKGLRVVAWTFIAVSVLIIFPLELARQAPMHWRFYPWVIGLMAFGNTLAVAWLTGGRTRLGIFFVPALFALTGIPWPTFLENAVAFPLMGVVTGWSAGLLHLLGYPATVAGNVITLPNCTVGVEEACSGLRSLQTALMVGLAAGELKRFGAAARIVLLVLAFGLALIGNQVRVLMLALAGIQGGSAAVAAMHDTAGYVVLGILLAGVAASSWVMGKFSGAWSGERGARRGDQISKVRGQRKECEVQSGEGERPRLGGMVLLGVAALAMLAAHAWYWLARGEASLPLPAMLEAKAVSGFVVDRDVPAAVLEVMRPDDWTYIRADRDGKPAELVGYHFYWKPGRGNARQMYHRPDACMPGAGWRIDGEVTRQTLELGGRQLVFNVFPFRNPGGRFLVYWAAYLNGQPLDLDFQSDLKPATAKLWDFIRNGVRTHSYEVAAFVMDGTQGDPGAAAAESLANRVFATTGQDSATP